MFNYKFDFFGSRFRKIDILCISLIVIWALIISLIYCDFNVKAYNDDSFSINFHGSTVGNLDGDGSINSTVTYNNPNNSYGIFFINNDFNDYIINNLVNSGWDYSSNMLIYVGDNNSSYSVNNSGKSLGRLYGNVNWTAARSYLANQLNINNTNYIYNVFGVTNEANYSSGPPNNFNQAYNVTFDFDNIQYVTSYEDLYKYLVDHDSSVVKIGNPFDDTIEDDSLPVPQELGTDIQNDSLGTPPFISGVWKNPDSLLASFEASTINVDIQYKPTYLYYKKVFNIKIGKYSSSEYIDIYNGSLGSLNRWIRYNAENGYPSGTNETNVSNMVNDIDLVASDNNIVSYAARSTQIDNGSKWRIRYRIGNKTSLWVVFNINSVGSPTSKETVSFENASGDSVSPEDVNYNNSSQTSNSNNLTLGNFFDNLSANIQNIVSSVSSLFNNTDNNTGGFFGFFKELFNKFPQFYAFLVLGLLLAILLRILGR